MHTNDPTLFLLVMGLALVTLLLTFTETKTFTITSPDVRKVWQLAWKEVDRLRHLATHIPWDGDPDASLEDVMIFALNEFISGVLVQIYLGDELVSEHAYLVIDETLSPSGPEPEAAPVGPLPTGARARIVIIENEDSDLDLRHRCFARRGWVQTRPFDHPTDAHQETYGILASGGYALERRLLINRRFAETTSPVSYLEKEVVL